MCTRRLPQHSRSYDLLLRMVDYTCPEGLQRAPQGSRAAETGHDQDMKKDPCGGLGQPAPPTRLEAVTCRVIEGCSATGAAEDRAPPTGLEPVTCRLTAGCSAN